MGFLFRLLVLAGLGALAFKMIERERAELAGETLALPPPDDGAAAPRQAAEQAPELRDAGPAPGGGDDFEARLAAVDPPEELAPAAGHFEAALQKLLDEARGRGVDHLDVNAAALHRKVGGYPGPLARMQTCCSVMRAALKPGDEVVTEPKSGVGATVTLRYRL